MAERAVAMTLVAEPSVIADMPDDVYHSDPVPEGSLSHSGAKKLLPPSSPALFKWERDNPPAPKRQFDFGHAAHKLALGAGLDVDVVQAKDWRTNAAKDQAKAARLRGAVPLLTHEWAQVEAMATALREHPIASVLLQPDSGRPEVSLFWRDADTGVMRRGRIDWLRDRAHGRLFIVDYKSTVCAEPQAFAASAARYGYHSQAPWYVDGATALGLAEDPAFLFIAQEKEPPYLVSVVELDRDAMRIGRERNRRAIDTYIECMTADHWPAYSDEIVQISLPRWAEYAHEQETA